MAEALKSGNLGVFDYYKMKNLNSDTDMRTSISKISDKNQKKEGK